LEIHEVSARDFPALPRAGEFIAFEGDGVWVVLHVTWYMQEKDLYPGIMVERLPE
jgi:hypothetical protein